MTDTQRPDEALEMLGTPPYRSPNTSAILTYVAALERGRGADRKRIEALGQALRWLCDVWAEPDGPQPQRDYREWERAYDDAVKRAAALLSSPEEVK